MPVVGFLQHFRTDDVGRHQVGGELDALPVEAEHRTQRFHQLGFGQARHADQQPMPAGQQGDQGLVDHILLPEDHAADALAHLGENFRRFFGVRDRLALQFFADRVVHERLLSRLCGARSAQLCTAPGQAQQGKARQPLRKLRRFIRNDAV